MKQSKPARKVVGYLRVSTADQDNLKFERDIYKFANDHNLPNVEFVSEKISGMKDWKNRKLYDLVNSLNTDDVLIVPELSRLGRSLSNVLDVLNTLSDKGVKVYSVKENFQINGNDMQSKVMRTLLGLFSEIEHDLIVARTKEGLAAARADGRQIGRPKGPGKSKLDRFEPELIALLKNGATKKFIAERYKVTAPALLNWLKRHNIKVEPEP